MDFKITAEPEPIPLQFGKWPIRQGEIFCSTQLSFAFVNTKPIVPGHVLVSSRRVARSFKDLTPDEICDLWRLCHFVQKVIEKTFSTDASTLTIQDGRAAGQTVPHVHVHIMPRKVGDFQRNDEIYAVLEKTNLSRDKPVAPPAKRMDDEERSESTEEEMFAEATKLRGVSAQMLE